jgi:hypothetical protein
MKLISFSLFNHPSAKPFERMAYVRIFFWNCRMARLIYPEWRVNLCIDDSTYNEFQNLIIWLEQNNNLRLQLCGATPQLCKGMLWRMKPCFEQDVTHVLCRDADALVTFREAQRVQQWLEGGKGVHSILDNPAHSGLMGGMVGFETAKLKAATSWNTWEQMVEGIDLSQRGSDQHLLNQRVLPHMITETHTHDSREQNHLLPARLPGVDGKYWESNLCSFFIGAAGVNELETIRFFKRLDEYEYQVEAIQKQYPKLFYWI